MHPLKFEKTRKAGSRTSLRISKIDALKAFNKNDTSGRNVLVSPASLSSEEINLIKSNATEIVKPIMNERNTNKNYNGTKIEKHIQLREINEHLVKKYISFICELCFFRGECFKDIQNHFREMHQDVKPYVRCCGRKLTKFFFISEHAQYHDDLKNKIKFNCTECDKVLFSKIKLNQHKIKCHPQNIYKCEHCSKVFKAKRNMTDHMNLHTNELIYTCHYCPSTFKTYSSVYAHENKLHYNYTKKKNDNKIKETKSSLGNDNKKKNKTTMIVSHELDVSKLSNDIKSELDIEDEEVNPDLINMNEKEITMKYVKSSGDKLIHVPKGNIQADQSSSTSKTKNGKIKVRPSTEMREIDNKSKHVSQADENLTKDFKMEYENITTTTTSTTQDMLNYDTVNNEALDAPDILKFDYDAIRSDAEDDNVDNQEFISEQNQVAAYNSNVTYISSSEDDEEADDILKTIITGNTRAKNKAYQYYQQDEELVKKYISMKCDLCAFTFESFKHVRQHFKEAHKSTEPYIQCCERKFKKRCHVVDHAYWHKNPSYFKCNTCSRTFKALLNLRAHQLTHECLPRLKCPYARCFTHHKDEKLLSNHLTRYHNNANPFVCGECEMTYGSKNSLKRHEKSVHPHLGRLCDKPLKTRHQSYGHNADGESNEMDEIYNNNNRDAPLPKTMDNNLIKKYIKLSCYICAYEGDDYRSIKEHFKLIHQGVKFYVTCCGRKLSERRNVVEHARQHDDPNYLKCTYCNKKLATLRSLREHFLSHENHGPNNNNDPNTKTKSFTCIECGKEFVNSFKLSKHYKYSHPNKTFTCEHCNKVFKAKRSYLDHLNLHTNDPIYKCPVCASSFRSYSSLYSHCRKLHPEERANLCQNKNANAQQINQTKDMNKTENVNNVQNKSNMSTTANIFDNAQAVTPTSNPINGRSNTLFIPLDEDDISILLFNANKIQKMNIEEERFHEELFNKSDSDLLGNVINIDSD